MKDRVICILGREGCVPLSADMKPGKRSTEIYPNPLSYFLTHSMSDSVPELKAPATYIFNGTTALADGGVTFDPLPTPGSHKVA